MRVLNDAALSRLRRMSEANMPLTATIKRGGAWVDTGGGSGYYAPGAEVTLRCRLAPIGDTRLEQEIAAQMQNVRLERMVYPVAGDLRADDNLTINGVVYTVVGLPPDPTYAMERHAVVRQVGTSG